MLTDHAAGLSLAQMPAILGCLGDKHALAPTDPLGAALTAKVVADANDVLYEMTRHNGAQMWTTSTWASYGPRLRRWMEIFEETGRRHGLTPAGGTLLGTDEPGVADLTTHILWGTLTARFPVLRPTLEQAAPAITALSDRIARLPQQQALRKHSDAEYGDAWCDGEIEASLRAVL